MQGYVSALRKAIGADAIVTRAPGYSLEVDPDAVDLHRFESLSADGAEALASHDPTRAAGLLREALALWRGEPLADLEPVEFVQLERVRLEELRLGALADRIDADLALALYRSGRQAEALDVYQQGRALLASELGIEPGEPLKQLEREILQHDESLASPPVAARPRHRAQGPARPWRRPPRRAGVSVFAVASLAVAALLAVVLTRSAASAPTVVANSIAVVDTKTNRVVGDVPIDGRPVAIAAGPAGVYVASEREGIVWRDRPGEDAGSRRSGSVPTCTTLPWASGPCGLPTARMER